MDLFRKKKKKKKFWFEQNQDAYGYTQGDNRPWGMPPLSEDRRDVVRRSWNI